MATKATYYAVARGFKPGIYTSWRGKGGAQEQTSGFKPDPTFRKFSTRKAAENFIQEHGYKSDTTEEFNENPEYPPPPKPERKDKQSPFIRKEKEESSSTRQDEFSALRARKKKS
jgi:viroplasmin and RNaseH domain-containing protein